MNDSKPDLPEGFLQEVRREIGRQIREKREQNGYSVEQMARLMCWQPSTVAKIEDGKFSVSIDYIARLAWHLDMDIVLRTKDKRKY